VIRIGIRELRQNASRYIDRVKAGETVQVTERGELVALLVAPDPPTLQRDRLIQEGKIIPATTPFELRPALKAPAGTPSNAEILDEQRAERLP
jgi:prevent-host-death family protein